MGVFGFSYIGLIYLLMLFIPNIIWSRFVPYKYSEFAKHENKLLLFCERLGQVLVVFTALCFSDTNIDINSSKLIWLVVSFILMILYEIVWVRYFCLRSFKRFYGSFLVIPCPLAVLPIFAFLTLGIYANLIWLIIATSILGIGHIGIHLMHLLKIKNDILFDLTVKTIGKKNIFLLKELFEYNDLSQAIEENLSLIKNNEIKILGLFKNKKIIGEIRIAYDNKDANETIKKKRVYLYAFRISKDYQNQGYGKVLMEYTLESIKNEGYKEVTIGVESDNDIANHIYSKFGFDEYLESKWEEYQGDRYGYDLYLNRFEK